MLWALALAACSSTPVQRPAPNEVVLPPAPPVVAPQLAAEQRWLLDLFQGTPVLITPGPAGELRVEVPLQFSFGQGQAAVKPALSAVLDKMAASLSRLPRTRVQIAAPGVARTDALRAGLLARGVAGPRIGRGPGRADAVELRLLPAPAGVVRLEDPPQSAGDRR